MKLVEALELLRRPEPKDARPLRVFLACGFTPLHLETYLLAYLRVLFPHHSVKMNTGLYGDLAASLENVDPALYDAIAVVIEWQDLDPRLWIRRLGGWSSRELSDILTTAKRQSVRVKALVERLSHRVPIIACLPTLPMPPLFASRPEQWDVNEIELRRILWEFVSSISHEQNVRVINGQYLDATSTLPNRVDIRSEVDSGFPYSLAHAEKVAELLALLIQNRPAKKGIITDLDDTLWNGILGEVGVRGVTWDLDHHSHMNGIYQQLLVSLSTAGVLIGVASKNDSKTVDEVFTRQDLLISREMIFPFEVHWGPKSESVERILSTWNIGPEAVVFIDDSPIELSEVQRSFPDIQCLLFPKGDYRAFWEMMGQLRAAFGKSHVSEEDSLRLESIKNASLWRERVNASDFSLDTFLRDAEASIVFSFDKRIGDLRALELINKTNQFNLNGKRLNESEWRRCLENENSFMLTVKYTDKYGALGKIATVIGKTEQTTVTVTTWVMSCRAFSRRVEHRTLSYLFSKLGADEIEFEYSPTDRNGPLQRFFGEFMGSPPTDRFVLTRATFEARIPTMHHETREEAHDGHR